MAEFPQDSEMTEEVERGREELPEISHDAPPQEVAAHIEDLPPADGAAILQELPPKLLAEVGEYLDPVTAANMLAEMDPQQAASVITDMRPPEASMVLVEMHPDDRVDILEHVPDQVHDTLIAEMTRAQAQETLDLERYAPDTAGGIMTPEVTALAEDLTVGQAIEELRRLNEQLEQMFYVYIVDKRHHLIGVLSMRDLILAAPDRRLNQIMRPEVRSVPVMMDQEEVARIFRKYGYLAVPVVDERNRLLGIITVDDVVDVMEEEATEDVQRLFGAGPEERLTSPWHYSFRKRVGWLIINLGTAFLAAYVVGTFEDIISRLAILAAYMPVVAGTGGNASAQAMAVTIRGLAVGRVDRSVLRQVLLREGIVGMLNGVVIGLITAGVALATNGNLMLGLVIGLALLINHTLACVSGAVIPLALKWLGFDPAQSATIFATTVTDVTGFFAFLALARMFLMNGV